MFSGWDTISGTKRKMVALSSAVVVGSMPFFARGTGGCQYVRYFQ